MFLSGMAWMHSELDAAGCFHQGNQSLRSRWILFPSQRGCTPTKLLSLASPAAPAAVGITWATNPIFLSRSLLEPEEKMFSFGL